MDMHKLCAEWKINETTSTSYVQPSRILKKCTSYVKSEISIKNKCDQNAREIHKLYTEWKFQQIEIHK